MREKFVRFMQGRYGSDQMNRFLITLAFIVLVLSMFIRNGTINLLGLLLLVWSYFRMLSRNISKRYAENQKYMELSGKVKGFFTHLGWRTKQVKDYHIYKCPNCGQQIRIPRGKGKISITCPKCKESFEKKS